MNKITQYLFFGLITFCIVPVSIYAQSNKLLSPKKMKKDLEELLFTMEAHPDPYQKISEEKFNALVDSVQQNISTEMDLIDFYKNLSIIISCIKDGHSSLRMPRFWIRNLRKDNGVLPLEFYLTDKQELYLTKAYAETNIPLGAKILMIEGKTISEIVNELSPYISYELESFRNVKIERDIELYLYLMFKQSNNLEFTYFQTDTLKTVVKNIDYKEWKKEQKDDREEREKKIMKGEPYDYEVLTPGIGLINIFSFSVKNINAYNSFLNKTFKKIKNDSIHSLIIDVRGNYGGSPKVASELFHYIYNGHFKTMAQSSMKVSQPYRRYFTDAYPELKDPRIQINFFQKRHTIDLDAVLHNELNSYVHEDAFYNEKPIVEKFEFKGDCYLLTNRISYSAASSFASTFQCYSMGPIIGESTGGTKIFRANAMYKKLDKYNMNAAISTTKLYTACYLEEDDSVHPNIEVVPTVIDRIHDVDSQLNYTIMLIKRTQKANSKN